MVVCFLSSSLHFFPSKERSGPESCLLFLCLCCLRLSFAILPPPCCVPSLLYALCSVAYALCHKLCVPYPVVYALSFSYLFCRSFLVYSMCSMSVSFRFVSSTFFVLRESGSWILAPFSVRFFSMLCLVYVRFFCLAEITEQNTHCIEHRLRAYGA